jgi:hypothetical protein
VLHQGAVPLAKIVLPIGPRHGGFGINACALTALRVGGPLPLADWQCHCQWHRRRATAMAVLPRCRRGTATGSASGTHWHCPLALPVALLAYYY